MSWISLQGQELTRIESRLGFAVRRSNFQGYVHEPPYYRQGALVRLEASNKKLHYIAAGEGPVSDRRFFLLDGSGDAIQQGNLAARIDIRTVADAESYLRFFCDFLHMPDGHCVRIVDALHPGWVTDRREAVNVAPPTVWESERDGLFHARAHVEYDGVLLIADFAIRFDGIVAMLEDEPIGRLVRHPIN